MPAAGFYDDGNGRLRHWDGSQWTDQYAAVSAGVVPVPANGASSATTDGILWSAVGQPLTGIGKGRYRLTSEFLFFERGTLSLSSQQIHCYEIHDVDATQSITQRARGVGTIKLTAQRVGASEVVLIEDVPNFREGVAAINAAAHTARLARSERERTQNINYSGLAPSAVVGGPVAAAPTTAAPADLHERLAQLVAYRDQGVLDEEEFTAAKRSLLGI